MIYLLFDNPGDSGRVSLTPYDKNKVHIAKAIIPFLIILHHCFQLPGLGCFKSLGIILVSFFFVMSGYGLMTSYMKGGGRPRTPYRNSENLQSESIAEVSCLSQGKKGPFEGLQNSSTGMDAYKLKVEKSEIGVLGHAGGGQYLESFFTKRILKIFIPYLVSLTAWLVYKALTGEGVNIPQYLISTNIGSWLPHTWFVWVIIASYFIFWGVFRLNISLRSKLILMTAFALGYYLVGAKLEMPSFWYRSSICIALGMIWRYYEDRIFSFISKPKVYYVFPVLCLGLFGACKMMHWDGITALFTCALFAWAMYSLKCSTTNKSILFLSKVSYEVYLLQCIAIDFVCGYTETTLIAIPLIFTADVVLAYLVHEFSELIHKIKL